MNGHQYRITVEYLGDAHADSNSHPPLVFQAGNHDDIHHIVEMVQAAHIFDRDTSAALVLGMKLFSEVMLRNRKDPLFEPMWAAYRDYAGQFKQRIKVANSGCERSDPYPE